MDRKELARKLGTLGYSLTALSDILLVRELDNEEKKGLEQVLLRVKEILKGDYNDPKNTEN